MSKDVFRRETWFEGHVQGVGFRAWVMDVARGYTVTGFVKNMDDGRVFLEAEGDAPEVTAFLEEVRRQLRMYIRKEEFRDFVGAALHKSFRIAF